MFLFSVCWFWFWLLPFTIFFYGELFYFIIRQFFFSFIIAVQNLCLPSHCYNSSCSCQLCSIFFLSFFRFMGQRGSGQVTQDFSSSSYYRFTDFLLWLLFFTFLRGQLCFLFTCFFSFIITIPDLFQPCHYYYNYRYN